MNIADRECPSLSGAARDLVAQFTKTFSLFGACHKLYSAKMLSEEELTSLGQLVVCKRFAPDCTYYVLLQTLK